MTQDRDRLWGQIGSVEYCSIWIFFFFKFSDVLWDFRRSNLTSGRGWSCVELVVLEQAAGIWSTVLYVIWLDKEVQEVNYGRQDVHYVCVWVCVYVCVRVYRCAHAYV